MNLKRIYRRNAREQRGLSAAERALVGELLSVARQYDDDRGLGRRGLGRMAGMVKYERKSANAFWRILIASCLYAGCAMDDLPVGAETGAISNGTQPPDVGSRPYLHAVVSIGNGVVKNCTGVLITPRLVLTAAHCFGFDSPDPNMVGIKGGDPSCQVETLNGTVIASGGCGQVKFTHLNGFATETANIKHAWVAHTVGAKSKPFGWDIAIAALDRRATPFTKAAAPSVPVWFEHERYDWQNATIVYAGWGKTDSIADTCEGLESASQNPTTLSVEWRKKLDGEYPLEGLTFYDTMFVAKFDLYGDSTGLILHGDSGGPLFSPDWSGAMRVIGVASGMGCSDHELWGTLTAKWARTFNIEPTELLRRIVFGQDGRSRGNDVDPSKYDDYDKDGVTETPMSDPNPWIPEKDNCVDVANPDQLDTDNDGIGEVCEGCPNAICTPPPPPPTNCRASVVGCGFVDVECDPLPSGTLITIDGYLARINKNDASGSRLYIEYTTKGETNEQWSVCAHNIGGKSCGTPFPVTLKAPCYAGHLPEYQCPWGEFRCQGVCMPIYKCKFLQ